MNRLDNALIELFNQNDTVVVALSGGADSVCLLHILKFYAKDLNLNVLACHVNHNLRGEESIRDLRFVEALCHDLDIKLFVMDEDIAKKASELKLSIEECGRMVRYDFFTQIAEQFDAKIATAHTLSDNVETLIFNLARGSGLQGICAIPKIRGNIVRPLLSMTRGEIESYCEEHNLSYVTDSTNAQILYTRNKIRHKIVPVLREVNPSFEQNIYSSINSFYEDNDFININAKEVYNKISCDRGLDLTEFAEQHSAIKARLAILFLRENSLEISTKNIEAVLSLAMKKSRKINISHHKYIENKDNFLVFSTHVDEEKYFESTLSDGEIESKTGKIYKIKTLETKFNQNFNISTKNIFEFFIDCGKICGSVIIRQRKSADFIKLSGSPHTKTLKKLFNEAKIDLDTRKKLFVIADDNGVIAVENFGIDKRVCCDNNTREYIRISEKKI